MKRTFIFLLGISTLFLSGCDFDLLNQESNDSIGQVITINQAPLIIGSEQHYEVIEAEVADDNPPAQIYLEKIRYEMLASVDNQSGYQATGEGPYLLIDHKRYGDSGYFISSSQTYIDASGELEFSINKDNYSNQFDTTFFSERDSTSLTYQLGTPYKTKRTSNRYDNNNHNLVYVHTSETLYTPNKLEEITTESGTYTALKIVFFQDEEVDSNYSYDLIIKSSGAQWLDVATGKLVKEYATVNMYNAANYGTQYEQSVTFIISKEHVFDKNPGKEVGAQASALSKSFSRGLSSKSLSSK